MRVYLTPQQLQCINNLNIKRTVLVLKEGAIAGSLLVVAQPKSHHAYCDFLFLNSERQCFDFPSCIQ